MILSADPLVPNRDEEERSKIIPLRIVRMRQEESVSPVIGSILMVAITVVLAAVLWLMVSSMFSTNMDKGTTVTMGEPKLETQTRAATTCWDTTVTILRLSPRDTKLPWGDLKLTVKSASGSLLYTQSTPNADMGVYPDDLIVRSWFVPAAGIGTVMVAGDEIKITSMDIYYEGALVELISHGQLVGMAKLPTDFT